MFEKPTLATLVQRAKADMMARVPGSNALLRHTVLSALAYVQAGLAYGAYSYLDYISKQILPDTADDEHLERHASLWGITRNAAVPAEGKVVFTGTDGIEIGPGQVLQRVDGAQYVTSATGRISGGTLSLDVVAVEADVEGRVNGEEVGILHVGAVLHEERTDDLPVLGVDLRREVAAGVLQFLERGQAAERPQRREQQHQGQQYEGGEGHPPDPLDRFRADSRLRALCHKTEICSKDTKRSTIFAKTAVRATLRSTPRRSRGGSTTA